MKRTVPLAAVALIALTGFFVLRTAWNSESGAGLGASVNTPEVSSKQPLSSSGDMSVPASGESQSTAGGGALTDGSGLSQDQQYTSPPTTSSLDPDSDAPHAGDSPSMGRGAAAIEHAAAAGKYLFAFFYKHDAAETQRLRESFDSFAAKLAGRAETVTIDLRDPAEAGIASRFNLTHAPMPFVLVLAPNGALMGGFPREVNEEKLLASFAGPAMEECLKFLQERKLVLLCVQNEETNENDAAMRGVREFRDNPTYTELTEIVMLNPADPAETRFLEQLKVSSNPDEAITVLLAPPGMAVGKFSGATEGREIEAALATVRPQSGGCCPGGSSSGCGPKQQGG